MKKQTLDKISCDNLHLEYSIRKLSYRDIQKKYNINPRTIKKLLEFHKIPIRYGSEAIKSQWGGQKGEQRRKSEYENRKDKIITTDGYYAVSYPNMHRSLHLGRVKEHILIMENHIGRLLEKGEVVHHKDENKLNNDIDNLELMTAKEHGRHHLEHRKRNKLGQLI